VTACKNYVDFIVFYGVSAQHRRNNSHSNSVRLSVRLSDAVCGWTTDKATLSRIGLKLMAQNSFLERIFPSTSALNVSKRRWNKLTIFSLNAFNLKQIINELLKSQQQKKQDTLQHLSQEAFGSIIITTLKRSKTMKLKYNTI